MQIKLTETELKNIIKECVNDWCNLYYYDTSIFGNHKRLMNESLIRSYAPGKIRSMLKRNPKYHNIGISHIQFIQKDDNVGEFTNVIKQFTDTSKYNTSELDYLYHFEILFNKGIKCDINIINDIIEFMWKCGWNFMCLKDNKTNTVNKQITNELISNSTNCSLLFEPNYTKTINSDRLPNECYHITPISLLPSIMRSGLQPKNNGREVNHQERVYLFVDYDNEWKNTIAQGFRKSGRNEPYVLLSVNISSLKNKMDFYVDSNFMNGNDAIYTLESIPPQFIKVIDKEEDDNGRLEI